MVKSLLPMLLCLPFALSGSIIPQSGYSGRPGDGTCQDCHPVKSLVAPDSSLILGLPGELAPETTYSCTLVIRYHGLDEWSFEMTTVDSQSNQAGHFNIEQPKFTLIDTSNGILYLKNSIKGAFVNQPDSARWAFDYTTPAAGAGPVSFYWCAYIVNRKQPEAYRLIENSLTLPQLGSE